MPRKSQTQDNTVEQKASKKAGKISDKSARKKPSQATGSKSGKASIKGPEELYELTLTAGSSDDVQRMRKEFDSLMKAAFKEEGKGDLITKKKISYQTGRTFPGIPVVHILIVIGEHIAWEIFMRKVFPILEKRFKAFVEKRRQNRK
jgi:hypothetical protein